MTFYMIKIEIFNDHILLDPSRPSEEFR